MNDVTTRGRLAAALAWAVCALALSAPRVAAADEGAGRRVADEVPAYEQFIVIPLRVHVLSADGVTEVDCKLTDEDVLRIVGKVNSVVWHKAGVHFGLESIRREPAARLDEFKLWRDLAGGGPPPLDAYALLRPEAAAEANVAPGESLLVDADGKDAQPSDETTTADGAADGAAASAPAAGTDGAPPKDDFRGLHVYYVHELPTNGVYFNSDFAFVKETASLREVEGGIDEPVPRVTAHELGHALGLRHRQDLTNLMASGTTGTQLNEAEVAAAREAALKRDGAADVATWRQRAESAERDGDPAKAKSIWSWLAAVPGDGAAEAAGHRDRLTATP